MLAGFAERDFTPVEGPIPGQIKAGYGEGKLTPLMAHAAVLESNGAFAVLLSLDIIFFTVEFANALRERLARATGIPTENIMVHTTHTHTGCETDITCWGCPANPAALIPVADAAEEAVLAAYESRTEVKMGTGLGFETRYSFCRDFYTKDGRIVTNPGRVPREELVAPLYDIDRSVNVIRFDSPAGDPLCFVVSYANHLDTTGKYKAFGADYAGYLRIALRRMYGCDVTVVFLNGCCGNINHYDFLSLSHKTRHCGKGLLASEQIGEGLAETVRGMQAALVTEEKEIFIKGEYRTFPTVRRHATEEMKAWARRFLDDAEKKRAAGEKVNYHDELCAEQYLAEDPAAVPKQVDVGIHVLQIGETVLVGLPGEIFSEIGLRIKANSPYAHTVVTELTDGSHGYITPDHVQAAGCYESIYSNIAYTGKGTADVLVNGATEMLRELHKEYLAEMTGGLAIRPKTW